MNVPAHLIQPIVEGMQARWRESSDMLNLCAHAYGWADPRTQQANQRSREKFVELIEIQKLAAEAHNA